MLSDEREEKFFKTLKYWEYRTKVLKYPIDCKKKYPITVVFPEGYENLIELKLAILDNPLEWHQFSEWIFVTAERYKYFIVIVEKYVSPEDGLEEVLIKLGNRK